MIELLQPNILIIVAGFGLIAIASKQIGQFFTRVKFPLITGFLLTGMIAGPYPLGLIPAEAAENLTCQALAVDSDKHRLLRVNLAINKSQVLQLVCGISEDQHLELTELRGQICLGIKLQLTGSYLAFHGT